MLEQNETPDDSQIVQDLADGFINSIPEKGPLFDKTEKREMTSRAITFGQLYNQLATISMGSRNLSSEQREAIMKRVDALTREASFWTTQSSSGRDFSQEIKEMVQSIWRR